MTSGENLKRDLGLTQFTYCIIQKVISFPIPFFIITVDSRRPSVMLGYQKIKNLKSSSLQKFKYAGEIFDISKFKVTPPIEIEQFNGVISSHGMIMLRDVAGEYFMDRTMYESRNGTLKKVMYEKVV